MNKGLALINAKIYTLNEKEEVKTALIIREGRIEFVGSTDEVLRRLRDDEVIDLNGRTVLPGFVDSHCHLQLYGTNLIRSVDLSRAKSLSEAIEMMKERSLKIPKDRWVIGFRWDESRWPEGRYPNRRDLDSAGIDNPVLMVRVDGHIGVVNSRAIELIKPPSHVKGLELDSRGRPTGILREYALRYFVDRIKPSLSERMEGILEGIKRAHELGITSIHEIGDCDTFLAYKRLKDQGKLTIRVYFLVEHGELEKLREMGFDVGWGDEWLRIGGVKLFMDGSFGAKTAALTDDYEDEPGNRGTIMYTVDTLTRIISELDEEGVQVAIHAIGDRGINSALKAFKTALKGSKGDNRHRIEHFELPHVEHLSLMAELGLIASMQPNFIGEWGLPGGMYESRLGRRFRRTNPLRRIIDSGIKVAFGSDCMPLSPLYGIHWAVNAPFKDQRISVKEAIKCYTLGGAYASFGEEMKGSIEIGKLADLVVLSEDPFEKPNEIKEIRVLMTIVGGRVVYSHAMGEHYSSYWGN